MHWLAIAIGGALGAMARYAVTAFLTPLSPSRFPIGTLTVNVLGSLLIGVFYVLIIEKAHLDQQWRHVMMVGFLGAFTTFSTFSLETFSLWHNGQPGMAISYIFISVAACLVAVATAVFVTQKFI